MNCDNCVNMGIYVDEDNPQKRLKLCEADVEEEDGAIILREVSNFDSKLCLLKRQMRYERANIAKDQKVKKTVKSEVEKKADDWLQCNATLYRGNNASNCMISAFSGGYVEGFLAAMDNYSIWHNGKQYIGSPERELQSEMKAVALEF